jgi:phosphoribosylanthranilate isomerase
MTKIKICGITNVEDALACVDLNVDYIGLIFAESKRQVEIATASEIVSAVSGKLKTVGVFKDQTAAEIFRVAANTGIDLLQLHGSEKPDFCSALPFPVIKALELTADSTPYEFGMFYSSTLLIDKPKEESDPKWLDIALDKVLEWQDDLPDFFFAGGLTPSNVADVVRKLHPFGVDVASGVEASPGKKDRAKLEAFCSAVREVGTNAVVG